MLLNNQNIKEFTREVQLLISQMKVDIHPCGLISSKVEPYWREIQRQERKKRKLDRKRINIKNLFTFIDENGLIYARISDYQHRVKNPNTGRFVDWWDGKKHTMRRADGSFGTQGGQKGFLLQEIASLLD